MIIQPPLLALKESSPPSLKLWWESQQSGFILNAYNLQIEQCLDLPWLMHSSSYMQFQQYIQVTLLVPH